MISTDPVTQETELLEMASLGDSFRTKISEYDVQIALQRRGELIAKATPCIATAAESQPVLLNFREAKPMIH